MSDSETNPHTWLDYTKTARSLLSALAEVQRESDGRFVKCTRAIKRHLDSIGELTTSAQIAFADEREFDRAVDEAYRVIVGLYFDSTDFFDNWPNNAAKQSALAAVLEKHNIKPNGETTN